jgi:hypothetical protein
MRKQHVALDLLGTDAALPERAAVHPSEGVVDLAQEPHQLGGFPLLVDGAAQTSATIDELSVHGSMGRWIHGSPLGSGLES